MSTALRTDANGLAEPVRCIGFLMRLIVLVTLLSSCGAIPVSVQSSKQTSKQTSKQEVALEVDQDVANDLNLRSSQGTASMPIIIICNMNNADNSRCAYPQKDGIIDDAKRRYKEAGQ